VVLTMLQKPDATMIAGYRAWQAMGHQVRRGEKAIKILGPVTRKVELVDRHTGEPIRDNDGRTQYVRQLVGVRPVSVFDASQVDPPVESPPEPTLLRGQAPTGLWHSLAELVEAEGFQLTRGDCGGANGLTDYLGREVRVRADVDDAQAVKTLAHELTHVLIRPDPGEPYAGACRGRREVEAESVALTLIWTNGGERVFSEVLLTAWRLSMRVSVARGVSTIEVHLLDDDERRVEVVDGYLGFLRARGCSPNTVRGYAYDLLHLWRFLADVGLEWQALRGRSSIELLAFLRDETTGSRGRRLSLTTVGPSGEPRLSAATVNRVLTAVSGFYDWAITTDLFVGANPIARRPDPAWARVSDRHQPFVGQASRQQPQRRVLKVRSPQRLPRPMSQEQLDLLFAELVCLRDRAMLLLMLHGGLRPGEVLSMHLDDVAYGRRRVFIRVRDDHPGGARPKSRTERVVDLYDPGTLQAVSNYMMGERPSDAASPFVFLVGGQGPRRGEPLTYAALVRMFARAAARAGIREPWITPHALRHTHATRMWEGGMRELTLQRRLGHSSVESTRLYTRVADHQVIADYLRALGQDGGAR
jgi:integrase